MRVLFLGNSHTYFNDMPAIFKMLYEAGTGESVEVTMQAHPYVTLGWHLNQGVELRFALLHENYDYIVIQQAAHEPCPDEEETIKDGKKIITYARECGTEPIICMPWAEKRLPEHHKSQKQIFTRLGKETSTQVDVTGDVFEQVRLERPDIDLYFSDGEHCSCYGSYVRALSAYVAITGNSPIGLPAKSITVHTPEDDAAKAVWEMRNIWTDLEPEIAEYLQNVVAEQNGLH